MKKIQDNITSMNRFIVTGGSGFIGTNMVDASRSRENSVLSIDINEPQNKEHVGIFRRVDILDLSSLLSVFKEFSPTHVMHLAARTDLHERKNIEGYSANITGVENIIKAISSQPSVVRCIFASTKLVCPTDHTPRSDDDYCPTTLYGESKAIGENIIKHAKLMADWCIVRPTSIWGPWSMMSHIPYGRFFQMIAKGRYFNPGGPNPPKSFGYVGNTVYQIMRLLDAPRDLIHGKIFYLSDYDVFTIRDWANIISTQLRGKKVRTIPEPIVRILAYAGDTLKLLSIEEPPFSSFRLRNMRADTSGIPLENLRLVTGPLPYTMAQGVDETIAWLRKYQYLR